MIIGVPKQVKNHEYRVGLTPHSVNECVRNGYKVVVETNCGTDIGASDTDYQKMGTSIIQTAKDLGYSYSPACDILK